jgi:hypothetical protein
MFFLCDLGGGGEKKQNPGHDLHIHMEVALAMQVQCRLRLIKRSMHGPDQAAGWHCMR